MRIEETAKRFVARCNAVLRFATRRRSKGFTIPEASRVLGIPLETTRRIVREFSSTGRLNRSSGVYPKLQSPGHAPDVYTAAGHPFQGNRYAKR
jgi:hypothetical protein